MYKSQFHFQRKALRFRQFSRKRYALFACLGRVVTIGVLSVATLQSATAAHRHVSTDEEQTDTTRLTDKEAAPDPDIDKTGILEEIEVTGSRAPLAIGQAARMTTVLSREDIQRAPVQSINDLLKTAVGVDVRQRGPLGAQTDVGIRGGTCEQVTILLNGLNICDPQTGHNVMDLPCDLSDIVRIEILEGPAARVYGTSSLVGAINVVTRRPQTLSDERGTTAQVRLEGGSFGYLSGAARISSPSKIRGGQGALKYPISLTNDKSMALQSHFSASATRADGYSRSKNGALNSDYAGVKAFYQGHATTGGCQLDWHAGVSTRGFGSNTFYSAKYDEQYEHTTKFYTALQGDVRWKMYDGRCKMEDGRGKMYELHIRPAVYWNRYYDRFELIRGSEAKVPFNHHRTDVFGLNVNSWFDWPLGRTALGAEFRNEDIVSGNLGEPLNKPHGDYKYGLNRSNLSFHLEHNILLRNFTLSAGFYAVKNTWNQMPFTLYPGIDASLRLGTCWKVYASYNTSLRMPSFTELYYSVGGHQADKYLKPEELHAVEGGVKYSSRWLTAQASIFHHHASNMIDWVMDTRDAEAVWQSVNHTTVNTLGQELTIRCQFPMINCQFSYCHLHQQKREEDYMQSRYSLEYLRHKLVTRLTLRLTDQLDLTLGWRWQDRTGTYTTTDGQVQAYRPYSVVDARLSWHNGSSSVYVDGNNLTGHRYVDFGNVPQPGCWFTVGANLLISSLPFCH